jgi:hypothetical protein
VYNYDITVQLANWNESDIIFLTGLRQPAKTAFGVDGRFIVNYGAETLEEAHKFELRLTDHYGAKDRVDDLETEITQP